MRQAAVMTSGPEFNVNADNTVIDIRSNYDQFMTAMSPQGPAEIIVATQNMMTELYER